MGKEIIEKITSGRTGSITVRDRLPSDHMYVDFEDEYEKITFRIAGEIQEENGTWTYELEEV